MLTQTDDSTVILDANQTRPIVTNVANILLRRVGPRYPNILLTFRYRLVRKTGLFFYEKEADIECAVEPDGWNSTGSFSSTEFYQEKDMQKGNRELRFRTTVFIKLHDVKANVGAFGSGADFTPPQLHSRIKIEGVLNTRGKGDFKSWLV